MYRFRPLREKDKPKLYAIINKYRDVPLKWRSMYVVSNYSAGVHVISCYNKVVGMVHITKTSSNEGWLESAYIMPSHRGRGVGSAFAKYQISQAKMMSIKTLRVATGHKNSRVQHLMIDKFGFSKPNLWHRLKLTTKNPNNTVPSVIKIRPDKVYECWSYIKNHHDNNSSGGLITSPQDNCWWTGLDPKVLSDILNSEQSLAYVSEKKIKGLLLVKKTRAMNFNSLTVLQSFTSSNIALEQMIRKLLTTNNTVFLSVSKDPLPVVNKLKKEASIKKISLNKWVVMEKQL